MARYFNSAVHVFVNNRRRRDIRGPFDDVRDIPTCSANAGLVPCSLLNNLDNINNENDFYFALEDLVNFVGKKCNFEWRNQIGHFMQRFKRAMICEGGMTPDGR